MSHACFVARKTHFHFTTHLRLSGAVFAVKTDFSQPASQPLQTLCGCPLPRQDTCTSRSTGQRFARTSPMRSRRHLQKHFVGNTTCRATDALPVKPSFLAQLGMCQPTSRRENALRFNPCFRSPACAVLTRAFPLPKPPAPPRFPCPLSTIQNAPPLFFSQTNPNNSVSGLRCHGERSEPLASKSAQRRVGQPYLLALKDRE